MNIEALYYITKYKTTTSKKPGIYNALYFILYFEEHSKEVFYSYNRKNQTSGKPNL
jgi:hypothetical protein